MVDAFIKKIYFIKIDGWRLNGILRMDGRMYVRKNEKDCQII